MKIKLKKLQQPTHETCCQTCLALITKKTIRGIVDLTNKSRGMFLCRVIEVLKSFKIKHDKVRPSYGVLPEVKQALIQIVHGRTSHSHLVIKQNNKIYDPWYGKIFSTKEYNKKFMRGFVYNRYIEIY